MTSRLTQRHTEPWGTPYFDECEDDDVIDIMMRPRHGEHGFYVMTVADQSGMQQASVEQMVTVFELHALQTATRIMRMELQNLAERVERLESERLPSRERTILPKPNPKLRWVSENRPTLIDQYPGEWIAVSEDGLLGHNSSLRELHKAIQDSGHDDATFIKVGRPVPAESSAELLV